MTTEIYECKGCHRNLFSYDDEKKEPKGGKRFNFECPMCGRKGWVAIDPEIIIYDKFLTDPKLKGKVDVPEPDLGRGVPPPPPGGWPKTKEAPPGQAPTGPTISLQIAVNPPDSLSKTEEFVLQELLNTAMAQFQMIVQAGQTDDVAAKMVAVKKQMESGVWTPDSGTPPGGECAPGMCGFPENL